MADWGLVRVSSPGSWAGASRVTVYDQEWKLRPVLLCPCARRLHAQGLTLAALVACAGIEYWEHSSGEKVERVAEKTRELSGTH